MMGRFLRLIIPPIVTLVVVVVFAQWIIRALKVPAYMVPPPTEIYQAGKEQSDSLLSGMWTTGEAAGIGFVLAGVVGVVCAIILSTSRLIERAFYPYTLFFQTVPIVAIAPLL